MTYIKTHKLLFVIILFFVIFSIIGYLWYSYSQLQSQTNNLRSLGGKYLEDVYDISSLPSTTTKTKDEWDIYYSSQSMDIQQILSQTRGKIYFNPRVNQVNNDITQASLDLINYLTLESSSSDMSFQITTDKDQVSNDKTAVAEQTNIYNIYPTGDKTLINVAKSRLSNDQARLDQDNKIYQDQKTQIASISATLYKQTENLRNDLKNF